MALIYLNAVPLVLGCWDSSPRTFSSIRIVSPAGRPHFPIMANAGGANHPFNAEDAFNSEFKTQAPDEPDLQEAGWLRSIWSKITKLGMAAVLAYGLLDGITYTSFFVLAFLGYEKKTGMNPAANLKALLGIVIVMWTGNNVTRPLRVAGAAALAPFIDTSLKRIQRLLNLPNKSYAFAIAVTAFASICFSLVGFLILSRWS